MIETALIDAPRRSLDRIFRRPLLERLLINCERAGIKRVYIVRNRDADLPIEGFATDPCIRIVDSFEALLHSPFEINPFEPCVRLNGNLVLSTRQLNQILSDDGKRPGAVVKTISADDERGGSISTGSLAALVRDTGGRSILVQSTGNLPFALNGRLEDRDEAERRLARALKDDTAYKDAPLARWLDRNLSWRISKNLALTSVTPNQVTIANTVVGLTSAWLFAFPGYWLRLTGSLLFLFSIIIDGVDGELARLTMTETKFGGTLDVVADNIVHVAVFLGIFLGCYRNSGSHVYICLTPLALSGFAACLVAIYLAMRVGAQAKEWCGKVDRATGRDFAYLLVSLALVNRLHYFAWGIAFGTYVFALVLGCLTYKQLQRSRGSIHATGLERTN